MNNSDMITSSTNNNPATTGTVGKQASAVSDFCRVTHLPTRSVPHLFMAPSIGNVDREGTAFAIREVCHL